MGFWIYMLIMTVLIPLTMIGFGRAFTSKAPKDINYIFGYRTEMSMKNKDTWEFAHNHCGKIWFRVGLIMLPITIFVMLLVLGEDADTVGAVGGAACVVQVVAIIVSIIPTEIALNRTFDKNGKRK